MLAWVEKKYIFSIYKPDEVTWVQWHFPPQNEMQKTTNPQWDHFTMQKTSIHIFILIIMKQHHWYKNIPFCLGKNYKSECSAWSTRTRDTVNSRNIEKVLLRGRGSYKNKAGSYGLYKTLSKLAGKPVCILHIQLQHTTAFTVWLNYA